MSGDLLSVKSWSVALGLVCVMAMVAVAMMGGCIGRTCGSIALTDTERVLLQLAPIQAVVGKASASGPKGGGLFPSTTYRADRKKGSSSSSSRIPWSSSRVVNRPMSRMLVNRGDGVLVNADQIDSLDQQLASQVAATPVDAAAAADNTANPPAADRKDPDNMKNRGQSMRDVDIMGRKIMTPSRMWYADLKQNKRGYYLRIREARQQASTAAPNGVKPIIMLPAQRIKKLEQYLVEIINEGEELQTEYLNQNSVAARFLGLQSMLKRETDEGKKASIEQEIMQIRDQDNADSDSKVERVVTRQIGLRDKVFYLDLMRRPLGSQFLRIRECQFSENQAATGDSASDEPRTSVVFPFGKLRDLVNALREMVPKYESLVDTRNQEVRDPKELEASKEKRLIFLGNLPWSWDSEKLTQTVQDAIGISSEGIVKGTVMERRGRSLGCALIEFAESDSSEKLISALNGKTMDGRELKVRLDLRYTNEFSSLSSADSEARTPNLSPQRKLRWQWKHSHCVFVRNLSFDTKWQDLKDYVEKDNKFKVVRAEVFYDSSGKSRGLARIELQDNAMVQEAIAAFNAQELDGRELVFQADNGGVAAPTEGQPAAPALA